MSPKLIVASGKSAGRTIAIKREKLLVGRADECDVRPLSEEVSRRHCAFLVEAGSLFVEDLRSRNGTFVNGTRIEGKKQLADGDIIRVGNLELKASCRAADADPSDVVKAPGADDEVSRWLMADDEPAGMFDTTRSMRVANDATVPVAIEDTVRNPAGDSAEKPIDPEATVIRGATPPSNTNPASQTQKKAADTSRAAAAEALKKFFGNR